MSTTTGTIQTFSPRNVYKSTIRSRHIGNNSIVATLSWPLNRVLVQTTTATVTRRRQNKRWRTTAPRVRFNLCKISWLSPAKLQRETMITKVLVVWEQKPWLFHLELDAARILRFGAVRHGNGKFDILEVLKVRWVSVFSQKVFKQCRKFTTPGCFCYSFKRFTLLSKMWGFTLTTEVMAFPNIEMQMSLNERCSCFQVSLKRWFDFILNLGDPRSTMTTTATFSLRWS